MFQGIITGLIISDQNSGGWFSSVVPTEYGRARAPEWKSRHWASVVYTVHRESCRVAIMGIDTPHDGASTGIYILAGLNDTSNECIQASSNDTNNMYMRIREQINRVVRVRLTYPWQLGR